MPNTITKVALIALSICSTDVTAWGQNGHRITGDIAQKYLSTEATKQITAIIGDMPLARLTTWPDEMRSNPDWDHAKPWHYVSIDDGNTIEQMQRNPQGDLLTALKSYENQLKDPRLTPQQKWQALAFFTHFLGDLHQPLHVGHSHDLGGNKVKVKWFNEETNLHRIWDSNLIEHKQLSYTEYSAFLPVTKNELETWQKGNYLSWAYESKETRDAAYVFDKPRYEDQTGHLAGWNYVYRNTPIVETRLKQAGVRIAYKLNQIFK
ncbi:S1/P1 nuclease [Paraferrimonas sp. SM1919]|uniref:S1/P1 nuclease n=1 Tax=Paraferrimonas sp. SM1919 TaxID=2662263 RepID=UPI0013D1F52D|nr:S1/P1 nuclease [Paraferrimonas sp. SM1919]